MFMNVITDYLSTKSFKVTCVCQDHVKVKQI